MGGPDATGAATVVVDDEAGAIAVAEYFLSLYPYVYDTGDLSEWHRLSHAECLFCARVAADVEARQAQGIHSEGGAFTVSDATGRAEFPGVYTVTMEGDQEPTTDRSADGSVVATPGATYRLTAVVLSDDGHWRVREVLVETLPAP